MRINIIISSIFIITILTTCVEPYEPNLDNYENVMIIDGMMTNLDEPYTVRITRSYAYNDDNFDYVTGAQVKIMDESGNEYPFSESKNGLYIKSDSTFVGVPGKEYKLWIQTPDENIYESEYQKLQTPVPIDRIYSIPEPDIIGDNDIYSNGVKIFVDVLNNNDDVNYFAWEYSETWQFVVPYVSSLRPGVALCYSSGRSKNFILENTLKFEDGVLIKKPLYSITGKTNRLMRRYSALVKQFTLSEEAYLFLSNLKTNNETTGSLFDPTPIMVEGNIKNSTNPDIPVMGFFQVSSVSSKRIFIDNGDLPKNYYINTGFESCGVVDASVKDEYEIDKLRRAGMIFMDTVYTTGPVIDTLLRFTNYEECFDCTLTGTKERPDFWVD